MSHCVKLERRSTFPRKRHTAIEAHARHANLALMFALGFASNGSHVTARTSTTAAIGQAPAVRKTGRSL